MHPSRGQIARVVLAGAAVLGLTGCGSPTYKDKSEIKPYVMVTPSGTEVVCTWNNWNGDDGNEWECEAVAPSVPDTTNHQEAPR